MIAPRDVPCAGVLSSCWRQCSTLLRKLKHIWTAPQATFLPSSYFRLLICRRLMSVPTLWTLCITSILCVRYRRVAHSGVSAADNIGRVLREFSISLIPDFPVSACA